MMRNMVATSGGFVISGYTGHAGRAPPFPVEQLELQLPQSRESTGITFSTWSPPTRTSSHAQRIQEPNRPEPTMTELDLPPPYEQAIRDSTGSKHPMDTS
ncbi:unnamed protein product [Darwinula stevensoni]|uniref:Uncharacterized protein n=1 Tax=Darwinula stevensoni TaxID=69355 RepID=A0A7R8X3E2_9CRUS|nr:unnamed protein product [Darwinula stevensoni]CAG0884431.1 unnamed protein product [Darwinula stevensoni]